MQYILILYFCIKIWQIINVTNTEDCKFGICDDYVTRLNLNFDYIEGPFLVHQKRGLY